MLWLIASNQATSASLAVSDILVASATASLASTHSTAQGIQIANHIKSVLDQLNSSLAGVNTLQNTHPGP